MSRTSFLNSCPRGRSERRSGAASAPQSIACVGPTRFSPGRLQLDRTPLALSGTLLSVLHASLPLRTELSLYPRRQEVYFAIQCSAAAKPGSTRSSGPSRRRGEARSACLHARQSIEGRIRGLLCLGLAPAATQSISSASALRVRTLMDG